MGVGSEFVCKNCGKEFVALGRCGVNYSQYYQQVVEEIKAGKYGKQWQETLNSRPTVVANVEEYIYICSSCNHWEVSPCLSLYAPRTGRLDESGDMENTVPYALTPNYHIIRRYYHKCPQCGRRMKRVSEFSEIPCPRCGTMCQGVPLLWD